MQTKETVNNDTELRETERDVQRRVEEGGLAGRYCVWVWVGNGNSNGNVY